MPPVVDQRLECGEFMANSGQVLRGQGRRVKPNAGRGTNLALAVTSPGDKAARAPKSIDAL